MLCNSARCHIPTTLCKQLPAITTPKCSSISVKIMNLLVLHWVDCGNLNKSVWFKQLNVDVHPVITFWSFHLNLHSGSQDILVTDTQKWAKRLWYTYAFCQRTIKSWRKRQEHMWAVIVKSEDGYRSVTEELLFDWNLPFKWEMRGHVSNGVLQCVRGFWVQGCFLKDILTFHRSIFTETDVRSLKFLFFFNCGCQTLRSTDIGRFVL